MGRLSPQINEIPTSKGNLDPVKRWQARATQRDHAWEMAKVNHKASLNKSIVGTITNVAVLAVQEVEGYLSGKAEEERRLKAEKERKGKDKEREDSTKVKTEQEKFLLRLGSSLPEMDLKDLHKSFTGPGLDSFIDGQNSVIASQSSPEAQLSQQSRLSNFLRQAETEISKRTEADTQAVSRSYADATNRIGGEVNVALANNDILGAEDAALRLPAGITQDVPGLDVTRINSDYNKNRDGILNSITIARNKEERELAESISRRTSPFHDNRLDSLSKQSTREDVSELLGDLYSMEGSQEDRDSEANSLVNILALKGVPTSVIRDALDSHQQDGISPISLDRRLKIDTYLSRIDNDRSTKATADYGNQLSTDALRLKLMTAQFEANAIAKGRNTVEMDERLTVIQDKARGMLSYMDSMPAVMSSDQIRLVEGTIAAVNRVSNIKLTLTEQSRRIDGILYQVKDGQPFVEHLLSNPGLRQTMAAEANELGIPYGDYLEKVIVSSSDDTRRMYFTLTESFEDVTLAGTGTSKENWNRAVSEAALKYGIRFGGDDQTEASDLQALVALAGLIQSEPSVSVSVSADEEVNKGPRHFVNMTSPLFRSYSPKQQERVVRGEAPGLAEAGWQPPKMIRDAVIMHEMQ